jgi:6-phosphogluconate dehydrogenase
VSTADLAIIGAGVMGTSLARNFQSRGHRVAVYDIHADAVDRFVADHDGLGAHTVPELMGMLERPRRILLMVNAGRPVDLVLDSVVPHLEDGDIVVDGGNSHYADTDRRNARGRAEGFRFMGMGVSGGEEGALRGPSMMPGGDPGAWEAWRPILEAAAARSDSGPCVTWCGHGSAGHFVKMVHNGIEYGDMQLIAEVYTLLSEGLGLSPGAVRQTFEDWNAGDLSSYLVEITASVVAARDPRGPGPVIDQILDVAGQKGTGRWTSMTAIEHGVPLPTVTAAVDGRALSALKSNRVEAEGVFGPSGGRLDLTPGDLEDALYAAKLMSYTQGFALLRTASQDRGYDTDIAAVSRIWKAGCIIRAAFLDRVATAFERRADLPLLFLDTDFAQDVRHRLPALRKVVASAVTVGIPVPALSASLAYFDTLSRARGSACVIQAQRDFFGAHTFRRMDDPDTPVHLDWSSLESVE